MSQKEAARIFNSQSCIQQVGKVMLKMELIKSSKVKIVGNALDLVAG